jgi:hypothetical protein
LRTGRGIVIDSDGPGQRADSRGVERHGESTSPSRGDGRTASIGLFEGAGHRDLSDFEYSWTGVRERLLQLDLQLCDEFQIGWR